MNRRPGAVIPGMVDDLVRIGVRAGDFLVVHSSFKSLGPERWLPVDVIRTLIEAVGDGGTLMMPTFTYSYSGIWGMRPFNPATSPSWNMGVLPETLRSYPGALRSRHPIYSVAAVGKHAEAITSGKENASGLGIGSSFNDACDLGARILLIGVGNNRNSMIHFAEAASGLPYGGIPFREFWGRTALVEKDGRSLEVELAGECPGCSANFGVADGFLEDTGIATRGKVCSADCMLMDARAMVEAVVAKLRASPAWLFCDSIVCEPCNLRKRRLREKGLI